MMIVPQVLDVPGHSSGQARTSSGAGRAGGPRWLQEGGVEEAQGVEDLGRDVAISVLLVPTNNTSRKALLDRADHLIFIATIAVNAHVDLGKWLSPEEDQGLEHPEDVWVDGFKGGPIHRQDAAAVAAHGDGLR